MYNGQCIPQVYINCATVLYVGVVRDKFKPKGGMFPTLDITSLSPPKVRESLV
jgi:hypothetical protein